VWKYKCPNAFLHCESKKGTMLSMAVTLSILDEFANFVTVAKSTKFATKNYSPHLKYLAVLPWKI